MIDSVLLYLGAALPIFWGVSHLFPTRSVVNGFGEISLDNRRVITMEWIVEGVALIFTGLLVATITFIDADGAVSKAVYVVSSIGLLSLAVVSLFTGFKINFLPYKMCPLIFTASAMFILVGAFL
ncbi:MAG: hypothetical protein ACE5Q6_21240 [Dehalococcoidia bacterium]